tara:strand:+ start:208 stop:492 length:285 start_codon:yes stop_codon:yes gene_type:complete
MKLIPRNRWKTARFLIRLEITELVNANPNPTMVDFGNELQIRRYLSVIDELIRSLPMEDPVENLLTLSLSTTPSPFDFTTEDIKGTLNLYLSER